MRIILKFLLSLAVAFLVMVAFRAVGMTIYTIDGRGLDPVFRAGDRVLVNRWSYGLRVGGGDNSLFNYGRLWRQPIEKGDKVLIIEDVTTAGTSIAETMPILEERGAKVCGLIVSVDRQERGQGEKSALKEIEEKYGFKTASIVTMSDVVEYLTGNTVDGRVVIDDSLKEAIDDYYRQYGAGVKVV